MRFALDQYVRTYPTLIHFTARDNLSWIRAERRLYSTASLLRRTGRQEVLREKRKSAVALDVDGTTVVLRDQTPLHAGNVDLAPGWTLEDVVEMLNQQVYFWPSKGQGPSGYGTRLSERYKDEPTAVLRIPFASLLAANPDREPRFCKYNSGAPRTVGGKKSPRGADTFRAAFDCDFTQSRVVEVVWSNHVMLPNDTEYAHTFEGPWRPLFVPAADDM